ncbi:hypothetical protein C8N29_12616 [Agitococcus lubricus]|uniref:Uncharacterized protein n=1 Tax=Agitococcus lubricus TaxID=1077255 RepID=A0A2T5IT12_9GAMM|nr:hypothetical protein C8N29_12616 [Agitococcus lubricus]
MGAIINLNHQAELKNNLEDTFPIDTDKLTSTHTLLRKDTHSLHQRLDSHTFLQSLLTSSLNQKGLAQALQGFY